MKGAFGRAEVSPGVVISGDVMMDIRHFLVALRVVAKRRPCLLGRRSHHFACTHSLS